VYRSPALGAMPLGVELSEYEGTSPVL
jgi:hypothetical protein